MPFNNENDYFFNLAFAAFVRSVAPPRNVLGELPLEDAGVFGDAFVETGARAEWVYVDGAVTPSPAASVVDDEIDESMEEDEESGFVEESGFIEESAMDGGSSQLPSLDRWYWPLESGGWDWCVLAVSLVLRYRCHLLWYLFFLWMPPLSWIWFFGVYNVV
ncbi:MAG: hypothetical protein EXX96DRAFT_653200 [Benjaminiella poitrasii]|nr:MAG: hypothetical protein EXX96DRAFT_653200 [Benjaminiella poitrasii]